MNIKDITLPTTSKHLKERRMIIRNIPILILFCLPFSLFATGAAAQEVKRVYIAASYEENHICGGPQEEGVIKGLNKTGWFEGMNLEVKRYYMDTKLRNSNRKSWWSWMTTPFVRWHYRWQAVRISPLSSRV